MNNFTDNSWDGFNISCENLTNHWLYFIFSGYLLPLISPKMRRYFYEVYNNCKHNKITGKIVTLTEFGFDKIQDIQNNNEMKDFIQRLCQEKNIEYNDEIIENITESFDITDDIINICFRFD